MTSPPLLATSSMKSMKTNVLTSPRTQEFIEESQKQKFLVGLLVMDIQVHPNINSGHGCLSKIDLLHNSDPNEVLGNIHEMSLHVFLAPHYQLATRSPRLERRLKDFHTKAASHMGTFVVRMAQLHL
jgi:hypothetical protein